MTVTSRIGSIDPRHRRIIVTIGSVIVLVALAVPIGLNAQRGGSPGASVGSAIGVAQPGKVPAAGESAGGADSRVGVASPGSSAPSAQDRAASTPLTTVPKLARSAWLGIKVRDVVEGSARVRTIALAAGGQVVSENIVTGPDPTGGNGVRLGAPAASSGSVVPPVGDNEARLTLSVPADKLDAVLSELSSSTLGTVSYRSSQTEDVTDTYIDTQARIQPAKDSIDRVRALLAKATSLDQIVLLESELSRRQADLDSLEQRFADLERRTTMSDVSVTLWTDATASVTTQDNGFVSALRAAGAALVNSFMIVVTGLAVLLPWLLLALAVGWFVRRWLRRHRRSTTGSPADPVATTATTS